jgi:hypothetical protein
MPNSKESTSDDLKEGCGCSLMILAVGLTIALVKLANAIAAGSIPPPW